MTIDKFLNTDSIIAPARSCFSIRPSDSTDLPQIPKAIYVGTGGDIVLRGADNDANVTLRNVPSGMILDIRAGAIRATGTTSSDLVGLL